MLHTPAVDNNGLGRYERGRHFYQYSRTQAESMNADFNWSLEVVTGVGHDYRKMGEAAAKLLYSR